MDLDVEAVLLITKKEARAFFDLLMISDPFPLSKAHHDEILDVANRVASELGYGSWEVAYHELPKVEDDV